MGFSVVEGPVVETDWHNFEALNMPPAVSMNAEWAGAWAMYCLPTST